MTEQQWLACANPRRMLRWLARRREATVAVDPAFEVSDRKLRLFACACCRQSWNRLTNYRSRQAVQVAERYADGGATEEEVLWSYRAACRVEEWHGRQGGRWRAVALCCVGAGRQPWTQIALSVMRDSGGSPPSQAALLRDLFGNPWRPAQFLSGDSFPDAFARHQQGESKGRLALLGPEILRWNDGTVPKMAQAIYDSRRFDEMPILADALEDAGADNAAILDHCRRPGEHMRGCWVLDLLLGKE